MYVKAYQDLSLKSLFVVVGLFFRPVHLGAWPGGSWLPWRAAPLGCVFVLVWFMETSAGIFLFFVSPFSPAQWAPPQLNGPVQHFSDRDS